VIEGEGGALEFDLLEFFQHRETPGQSVLHLSLLFRGEGTSIPGLSCVEHLLEKSRGLFFPASGTWAEHVHVFLGFHVRDDRQGRKRVHVGTVAQVVIVVEVGVEQKAHRPVRPLTDLCDVFPGS